MFVKRAGLAGVGTLVVLASCAQHAGPARDGGDARGDAREADTDADSTCLPADAQRPEASAVFPLDGGVPLDAVARGWAAARCGYWARCSPLASYVVDACIDALSRNDTWHFTTARTPRGLTETQTIRYPIYPSAELLDAVDAGLVQYDPDAERACLQALGRQQCHGVSLWELDPACASVFRCVEDGDAADGGASEGGAADGGVNCAALTGGARPLCAVASDCADAGAAGPYCVQGFCAPAPCGDEHYPCPTASLGAPCDSDPPFLGNNVLALPDGKDPTMVCAGGLTCAGLGADGGLGRCAVPGDLGDPCAQGAVASGCALGLTCVCGVCQLAPARGPCALGACRADVAYCDSSDTCVPLLPPGGDCTVAGAPACPPDLVCDSSTSVCEAEPLSL